MLLQLDMCRNSVSLYSVAAMATNCARNSQGMLGNGGTHCEAATNSSHEFCSCAIRVQICPSLGSGKERDSAVYSQLQCSSPSISEILSCVNLQQLGPLAVELARALK